MDFCPTLTRHTTCRVISAPSVLRQHQQSHARYDDFAEYFWMVSAHALSSEKFTMIHFYHL